MDRPIDPAILERAKKLANQYRIILEPDDRAGYLGSCLEMPGVMDEGKTPDACVAAVREALVGVVAFYFEEGQIPPSPASDEKRTVQVNVRLTEAEKLRLTHAANRDGFKGLSDFIRAASLTSA